MSPSRRWCVTALLSLWCGAASAQEATPDDTATADVEAAPLERPAVTEPTESELEDARHAFEVGAAAFENGDYETASTEFRHSYELSRHPSLLYNIYLAEERAGRPGEAAIMLERYLESSVPTDDERTILERRLARLRTRAASREPVVDPTENEADRAALIVAPTDASGREWDTAERPAAPTRPPTAGIALLVTGGVLLVGFAVLAPLSEVEDQRLASTCGRSAGRTCTSEETSTLLALDVSADIAWIGGAASAAVGLVLLFALPPEQDAPSVAIAPALAPDYAGLIAAGSF